MVIFILIIAGLIFSNFILLKFSVQSVDANKKKGRSKKISTTMTETDTTTISKAA